MSLDVYLSTEEDGYVFDYNITHNLNKMAEEANLYKALWRPEEIAATKAKHVIEILSNGLVELVCNEDYYKGFNPDNGWGSYEGLVKFVAKYLNACIKYPNASIEVSR